MSLETTIVDITGSLRQGKFPNEQAVSQGIVLRSLQELRWDIWETPWVWPEYQTGKGRADFAPLIHFAAWGHDLRLKPFQHYPWKSGYGSVGPYNDSCRDPFETRGTASIRYSSPGWIKLALVLIIASLGVIEAPLQHAPHL